MEIALTPMEFARRARRLYAEREAVVDGDLRFTYAQFLERCDRWSSALQELGENDNHITADGFESLGRDSLFRRTQMPGPMRFPRPRTEIGVLSRNAICYLRSLRPSSR